MNSQNSPAMGKEAWFLLITLSILWGGSFFFAEIALRPDRYATSMAQARRAGAANLALMNEWVDSIVGLSWVPPRAGLIGLGRLPEGIDSDAFAKRLLAEPYRTFLLPGSAYGQPGHIRLGVGGGAEVNLSKGLDRVAQALKDWA